MAASEFYNLKVKTINGEEISMESFIGKTLLIVNVASKCGYTPQYKGLEDLYKKYKDKGLVVMGFPCNQFGAQEPGTEKEIAEFCDLRFGVTFPMFAKIDVNGEDTHPLYKFLKHAVPGALGTENIKWNFTKFLIDKNGKVLERFAPQTEAKELAPKIEPLLN